MAADLLGRVVQRGPVAIRLTEVEAYAGPGDPGSHAARGPTPRTRVMFGPPGHLYVYLSYGMHHCVNVVCGPDGEASAVLLRAGEVVAGAALARERRDAGRARPCADRDLARGPACLGQAFGLSRADSGEDACGDGATWFAVGEPVQPSAVRRGPRVGVSGPGGDGARYPWRCWVHGDPSVSTYRAAVRRVRTR